MNSRRKLQRRALLCASAVLTDSCIHRRGVPLCVMLLPRISALHSRLGILSCLSPYPYRVSRASYVAASPARLPTTGSVIPGARVTVSTPDKTIVRVTTTDPGGAFAAAGRPSSHGLLRRLSAITPFPDPEVGSANIYIRASSAHLFISENRSVLPRGGNLRECLGSLEL